MVNTRRKDSVRSNHDNSGIRYRTRRVNLEDQRVDSSNDSDSVSDGQQDEDLQPVRNKASLVLPSRVRELRSRFVCNDIKYNSHHLHNSDLPNSRKALSLSVYSRKMNKDDLEMYNSMSDEDLYRPRAARVRHLRSSRSTLARIERRTALSLRPISMKSYADPHSPLTMNSDSDEKECVLGLRRSTRKRKMAFKNLSWLADNQMCKVGYPNFDSTEYSEEDSRDAQMLSPGNAHMNCMNGTRRSKRHPSENVVRNRKNAAHIFDTDSSLQSRSAIKLDDKNDSAMDVEDSKLVEESVKDKENKDENGVRVAVRSRKVSKDVKEDDKSKEDKNNEKSKSDSDECEGNDENDQDSGSEVFQRVKTRRQRKRIANSADNFSPRRTRNRNLTGSSSSSEVGKVYSLRNRAPRKQQTDAIRPPRVHTLSKTINRRRIRRYKEASTSDSDITTDDEDRCRKPDKFNKKNDQRMKSGSRSKIAPICPETLDTNIRFNSIGGLDEHIRCLKEMIVLPMMYPEVFRQFQIQPPRGVLFHGPPGCGKTLLARALANECNFGSRKVSFFMRKGADLLSKWVGESEKQLRMLFQQAAEMKPSIIFFDELDGLAPVRSSKQEQWCSSIVTTLLALMDGIDDRGDVIVIGATNRIDSIDPALRRPGRFDRELLFTLPARKEREEILNVHVSQWTTPPNPQLLTYLADNAVGYCGSDLKALCTEAVIQGFRRSYPQVYESNHRLLLDPNYVKIGKMDFVKAKSYLIPASQRIRCSVGRKLLPVLQPILQRPLKEVLEILEKQFPHGFDPALLKVKLTTGLRPTQLLLAANGSNHGQTLHLAPAILHHMEHIPCYTLDLATLNGDSNISPEQAAVKVFSEARRNVPCIVYIPCIDDLWSLTSDVTKAIIISQLAQLDPNIPLLLIATSNTTFQDLPEKIQNLFSAYRNEIYHLSTPGEAARRGFFEPLILDIALRQPRQPRQRPKTPPPLPRAPTPPPTPLTEEQCKRLYETEEKTLTELRIFLRDMCKKLANNKLFYMFTKPVDTEEVPDYTKIIKHPMDLETMMTKVDCHHYECAQDFLNDIELIVQNALEYNPAKTSADKQIRHRACSLRDYAHALIKNEMDSDFEDKCQDISKKRKSRKINVAKYLPPYVHTPEDDDRVVRRADSVEKEVVDDGVKGNKEETKNCAPVNTPKVSPVRKRKIPSWQRGYLTSKKKKRRVVLSESVQDEQTEDRLSSDEESKENTPQVCAEQSESLNNTGEQNKSSNENSTTTPLNVNCDNHLKNERTNGNSASRDVFDDDRFSFDEFDEAEDNSGNVTETVEIHVCREELEELLEFTVKETENLNLQFLLDLYGQMNSIIKKYLKTHERKQLPKVLRSELNRFLEKTQSDTQ